MKNCLSRVVAVTLAAVASTTFAHAPTPQPQMQGSVTYLSGGAGSEEVDYLKSQMKDYSLALMFSRTGGEYAANVAVTVKDARGNTVFEAPSTGPFLLVKLPAGNYSVVASYRNDAKTRTVAVDRAAKTPTSFVWP